MKRGIAPWNRICVATTVTIKMFTVRKSSRTCHEICSYYERGYVMAMPLEALVAPLAARVLLRLMPQIKSIREQPML